MFREMRRFKQQISNEKCIEILKNEPRGVLSVMGEDGYPYGVPINHYYDEKSGNIYFHGSKQGHKIDSIMNCDKVSLCVYDKGYRKDGEWALNINSVIVFGRIKPVEDMDKIISVLHGICHKFTDDEKYIKDEIEQHTKNVMILELVPEYITGKLVNES